MASGTRQTVPERAATLVSRQRQVAYVPAAQSRKSAKAQDAGLREEELGVQILHGRRNPGARFRRCSTARFGTADISQFLPFLTRLGVPSCTPEVEGRPVYNVLIEYKSQSRGGSVDMKIMGSILDLASAADEKRFIPVVVISSPTGVFSDAQLTNYNLEGKRHGVVVLSIDQARNVRAFHRALGRVARDRNILYGLVGSRGGLNRLLRSGTQQARAFVGRADARHNLSAAFAL
jgi:hypothetical protein